MLVAHEKWFVDDPGAFPTDFSFLTAPSSLAAIAVAAMVAVGWRLAAQRAGPLELPFLARLGGLAPWIPRLLGVHLGVSLLALAVSRAYLAPHLELEGAPGAVIALFQGLLGVWLVTGVALRVPALGVVLLGPLGLVLAGPVAVLEAVDLLGIAVFLALLPPGADRWGASRVTREQLAVPLLVLRICAGLALIVLSVSEKFANPSMAVELLERYPALDLFALAGLDVGPEAFVRFAAATELLFGLLVISGAAPQIAVLVAGIPFNATLYFFGATELIGHLPLYGILLALLVYGSDRDLAPVVPRLSQPVAALLRGRTVTASG